MIIFIMVVKLKNFYENGFTIYSFYIFAFCYLYNSFYNNALYNLYAITACWNWGIIFSFHSALFFDKYLFHKFAIKLNVNIYKFHIGNIIYHIVPCYITYIDPPKYINNYHGIIAASIHVSWIYIVSKKSFSLNKVYVELKLLTWYKLYCISTAIELITPTIFNYI